MQKITITRMKQLSKAHDRHFFDRESMRAFNSKIESQGHIISGYAYFVTSEQFNHNTNRGFSIRTINLSNGVVDTVGTFNIWAAKKYAMRQLKDIITHIHKVNTSLGENNTCNL